MCSRLAASAIRLSRAACLAGSTRQFSDVASLKRTALYDFHIAQGAEMGSSDGWCMPKLFKDSEAESATWCRSNASVFDVSDMCGLTVQGKDSIPFLESLVVSDIAGLKDNTSALSVLTNEKGGCIDDTIISKVSADNLYLVINGGCRDKDVAHISSHLAAWKARGKQVEVAVHDERSILGLQGPKAAEVLQALTQEDLTSLVFFGYRRFDVAGVPVWCTRTGYTGEDGFEFSVPHDSAQPLMERLLAHPAVRQAGTAPRNALRVEAGLCLYGHELDESISLNEAGLAWTVGKRRREKFDFLGGDVIKKLLAEGVTRRRVGFISEGAPARQHSDILTPEGKKIGEITSGVFSPCLKRNISMGYIEKGHDKAGTKVKLVVRGTQNNAEVVKMPFVPTNYYRG